MSSTLARCALALVLVSLTPVSVFAQEAESSPSVTPTSVAADPHLANAAQIQAATRQKLAVLGDAFTCADARFVSYRRSDKDPEVTDQWYVASQLWADAFLLDSLTPSAASPRPDWSVDDARCYLNKGFVFLDRLWDYTNSGYLPHSNPVGTSVKTGPG